MEGKAKLTLVDTMLNSFVFMVVQRKVQWKRKTMANFINLIGAKQYRPGSPHQWHVEL
jgi:hypothetical protein